MSFDPEREYTIEGQIGEGFVWSGVHYPQFLWTRRCCEAKDRSLACRDQDRSHGRGRVLYQQGGGDAEGVQFHVHRRVPGRVQQGQGVVGADWRRR